GEASIAAVDRVGRTVVVDRSVAAGAGAEAGDGPAAGAGPAGPCGILFVPHTGIRREYLPQELGFGSGMACRRRPAAWNEAGAWDEPPRVLLKQLRSAQQPDWSRAVIDSPPGFAGAPPPTSGWPAGAPKRSQPGRPGTAGQQAPRPCRRPGRSARGVADRRKPRATSPSSCPCWTRSPRWPASSGGHADGRTCSSPTAATTTTSTDACCGSAASALSSPSADSRTAPAWASSAGSWSGRSPGCTASAACGSAGNGATTSTKPFSASPPASSPTATSHAFV
ncbi:LOW QUALITY PROTEIN: conserved hypothetical protein, partial [Streptomyces viridosporus ATCC 14672]